MSSFQCIKKTFSRKCLLLLFAMSWFALIAETQTLCAQSRVNDRNMPPGAIAWRRQLIEPSLETFSQPVKVVVPDGVNVQVWNQGSFGQTGAQDLLVGLQIGPVYRLKVTTSIRGVSQDIYPSIELVDRLYPPDGLRLKHPVKIVIDPADVENALSGKLVNKVIYLENPKTALPYRQAADDQPFFDVPYSADAYEVAESMGRPMAILRIGSRQPIPADDDGNFAFYSPPVEAFSFDSAQQQLHRNTDNPNFYRQYFPAPVPADSKMNGSGTRSNGSDTKANGSDTKANGSDTKANGSGTREPAGSGAKTSNRPRIDAKTRPANHTSQLPRDVGVVVPSVVGEEVMNVAPPVPSQVQVCPPCHAPPPIVASPQSRPDEYVCDGSDSENPSLVDSRWNVYGLDIEDTIGHFDTLDGRRIVAPSNKVCIYSPRFAAVRQLVNPGLSRVSMLPRSSFDRTSVVQKTHSDFSTLAKQNIRLQQNRVASHASGFRDTTRGIATDTTIQLNTTRLSFKAFEDLQFVRYGKFTKSEIARLGAAVQSAVAWDIDVAAQMEIHGAQPIIVNDVYKMQEIVGIEAKGSHPTLRVCKLASKISAKSGDTVDFTIRFDNIGRNRIGNVTIIDNLSPRLEFVDGSAECSVRAEFKTEANDAGSLVMRWEIVEPLEAREGGLIRFQCRVR